MENDKKDKKKILLIGVALLAIIILIVIIISRITGNNQVGDISESKYKNITIDLTEVKNAGFPDNLYTDFYHNFFDSLTILEQTCNKHAQAKNVKKDGDKYSFKIIRCNVTYDAVVENNGKKSYTYTISKDGQELISYNSEDKESNYKSKNTLSSILPLTMTTANGTISITAADKNDPTALKVGINSCGDQEIKDKALATAKEYLKMGGYNPDDFTYTVPDYCDSEF